MATKGWTMGDIERIRARQEGKPEIRGEKEGWISRRSYNYFIGIDCGVQTGLAIYIRSNKSFNTLETTKIHTAMARVKFFVCTFPGQVFVRIEDARQRKIIPHYESESRERGRREGAGYVKRDAVIWEDFLDELGCDYEMVAPKDNATKMDSPAFQAMTGYAWITSQHARDAAALVYGF